MNKIELIATDLDGTLLDQNHCLTAYSKNIWGILQEKKIPLVPVTGRTLSGLQSSLPYEMCNYTINTNGVHLFKNNQGEPQKLLDESMSWNTAFEVFCYIETKYPQILIQAYVDEDLYSTKQDERTQEYTRRSGLLFHILNSWNEIAGSVISKIMLLHDYEELLPVEQNLSSWTSIQSVFSMPFYLEIFNKNASKGNALTHLANLLQISMTNVLSIGDSFNDLAMLEVCGLSYVMKNADKRVAPHLPRTEFDNTQDGVVKLIETLVDMN